MKVGKLIIFEGIDKCGKSTQIERLAGYFLSRGCNIFEAKEPPFPDNEIPDHRKKIMELRNSRPDLNGTALAEAELELFGSIRKIYYAKRIIPALVHGAIVLCDRSGESSVAYQGYGRGFDVEKIRNLNKGATYSRPADLTILFDLDPSNAKERITEEDQINRFEKEPLSFFEKIRTGYLREAERDTELGIKKWHIVDASKSKNEITKEVIRVVQTELGL